MVLLTECSRVGWEVETPDFERSFRLRVSLAALESSMGSPCGESFLTKDLGRVLWRLHLLPAYGPKEAGLEPVCLCAYPSGA